MNAQGEPRIYLNSDDLSQLHEDLKNVFSGEAANFIIAYRQASEDYDGDEEGISASEVKLDLNQEPKREISQVLDLKAETSYKVCCETSDLGSLPLNTMSKRGSSIPSALPS